MMFRYLILPPSLSTCCQKDEKHSYAQHICEVEHIYVIISLVMSASGGLLSFLNTITFFGWRWLLCCHGVVKMLFVILTLNIMHLWSLLSHHGPRASIFCGRKLYAWQFKLIITTDWPYTAVYQMAPFRLNQCQQWKIKLITL